MRPMVFTPMRTLVDFLMVETVTQKLHFRSELVKNRYIVQTYCIACMFIVMVLENRVNNYPLPQICYSSCWVNIVDTDSKSQTIYSLQAMKERCDGKNSCAVEALNSIFGDPCGGIYKYLTATWECHSG